MSPTKPRGRPARTAAEFIVNIRSRLTYPPNGCWLWPPRAARSSDGYPVVAFRGKLVFVTRVLWTVHYGVAPKAGLWRTCDDPSCVSPYHRREGGKYAPHEGPREHWPEEDRDWKPSDVPQKEQWAIAYKREVARKAEVFSRTGYYPFDNDNI